jgi:hypothetical protein
LFSVYAVLVGRYIAADWDELLKVAEEANVDILTGSGGSYSGLLVVPSYILGQKKDKGLAVVSRCSQMLTCETR